MYICIPDASILNSDCPPKTLGGCRVTEGHGLREQLGVGIGIRNECFDDLGVIPFIIC